MARHIRDFLSSEQTPATIERVAEGIAVFCYNNSTAFTREFLSRIGMHGVRDAVEVPADTDVLNSFVDQLLGMNGECVFLLRDTYAVMRRYQARAKKGFGVLVNRQFLCRDNNEEDYFALVEPIYDAIRESRSEEVFLESYIRRIKALIETDEHWRDAADEIVRYVDAHRSDDELVWVDWGVQFTFSLFCYASMQLRSSSVVRQRVYSFTMYPWLPRYFRSWCSSDRLELTIGMERSGRVEFKADVESRAAGALLGFAIGDALGFPAAGIEADDVGRFLSLPITDFAANPQHPHFAHLQAGQFTDNTILLMASARALLDTATFDEQKQAEALADWAAERAAAPNLRRWPGPTALAAGERLVAGEAIRAAGSQTSDSCSAAYRVVPLGIRHRPFVSGGASGIIHAATQTCTLSHQRNEPICGCVILTLVLADLLVGCRAETALLAALHLTATAENAVATRLLRVVTEHEQWDDDDARRLFGTSSLMRETLPLAFALFLNHQTDFRNAALAGANSFRRDSPDERARLAGVPWARQLELAQGGNTDGIGAITGTLAGCYVGVEHIAREFRVVEAAEELIALGRQLITAV